MWIDPGTAVDSAMSSVTTAGLIVYLLEWAKKSAWVTAITPDRKTLLRWLNALTALAAAVGLHYTYTTDGLAPGMMARVVLDIPTWGTIATGLWAWGQQWVLQQMAYDGIIANAKGGPVLSVAASPATAAAAGGGGAAPGTP